MLIHWLTTLLWTTWLTRTHTSGCISSTKAWPSKRLSPPSSSLPAPRPGPLYLTLQLDSWLPHWQIAISCIFSITTARPDCAFGPPCSTLFTSEHVPKHSTLTNIKELIVDLKGKPGDHAPVFIGGSAIRVSSIKFWDVHISVDLTWAQHLNVIMKVALLEIERDSACH